MRRFKSGWRQPNNMKSIEYGVYSSINLHKSLNQVGMVLKGVKRTFWVYVQGYKWYRLCNYKKGLECWPRRLKSLQNIVLVLQKPCLKISALLYDISTYSVAPTICNTPNTQNKFFGANRFIEMLFEQPNLFSTRFLQHSKSIL